jgi:hypothetical protein
VVLIEQLLIVGSIGEFLLEGPERVVQVFLLGVPLVDGMRPDRERVEFGSLGSWALPFWEEFKIALAPFSGSVSFAVGAKSREGEGERAKAWLGMARLGLARLGSALAMRMPCAWVPFSLFSNEFAFSTVSVITLSSSDA